MGALVAIGDPANALLYGERHLEWLGQELGIAPPAEFEALVERMHRGSSAPTPDLQITHGAREESDADSTAWSVHERRSAELPEPLRWSARTALRLPRWGFALASFGAILVGAALGVWFLKSRIPVDTSEPALAILNLKNLGSPQDSLLALGLTDALATRLAKIRDLRIALGGGALSEGDLDLDRIAERLGASHVLTGTFYRAPRRDSDSRIRVSVQLVDAVEGTLLWAHVFESAAASMFAMYSDIGENVAQALNLTLLEVER